MPAPPRVNLVIFQAELLLGELKTLLMRVMSTLKLNREVLPCGPACVVLCGSWRRKPSSGLIMLQMRSQKSIFDLPT